MKKLIITLLVVCAGPLSAFAENWSVHCENDSCVASHGGIKVYWMSKSSDNKYDGKLTGVYGLPLNMTDLEASDRKMVACFDACTPKPKEDMEAKETAQSAQNDYTLAFVNWLGNSRYEHDKSIRRYWWACEDILLRNASGTITSEIEAFAFSKYSKRLSELPINTPLNDKNRQLIITKWFTIKKLLLPSSEFGPYGRAYSILNELSSSNEVNNKIKLEKLFVEYTADMEKLKMMLEPGRTAKKLAASGKSGKDLAFAKWIIDSKLVENNFGDNLADSYMFSIAVTAGENKDKELVEKFEQLLNQNDASVNKITVEESPPQNRT